MQFRKLVDHALHVSSLAHVVKTFQLFINVFPLPLVSGPFRPWCIHQVLQDELNITLVGVDIIVVRDSDVHHEVLTRSLSLDVEGGGVDELWGTG